MEWMHYGRANWRLYSHRGQKVTVVSTRNTPQTWTIMPQIKEKVMENTAHVLSPLCSPEFQFYLAMHTKVKIMFPRAPNDLPLRKIDRGTPSLGNLDYWFNFVIWGWGSLASTVKNYYWRKEKMEIQSKILKKKKKKLLYVNLPKFCVSGRDSYISKSFLFQLLFSHFHFKERQSIYCSLCLTHS